MKKYIVFLIVLSIVLFAFVSCHESAEVSAKGEKTETYLIFGLDEAAENTDVLMLVSVNPAEEKVTVLQIPRDTYYRFGASQNKINQVYACSRLTGHTSNEAAQKLVSCLCDSFGISIDGYVGVTTAAFRKMVDTLGGIAISLPEDYVFDDGTEEGTISIPKGNQLLDGEAAEKFVRFRKAYKRGDLSRLDAQKIFLSSFLKTVKSADTLTLLTLAAKMQSEVVTCFSISESARKYIKNRDIVDSKNLTYATLPGEAMLSETGLSYYVLNKKSCLDIFKKHLGLDLVFDPGGLFYNASDSKMVNIYFDAFADQTEYFDDTLGDLRILSVMNRGYYVDYFA